MQMQEVRKIAKQVGVKAGKLTKADLIHEIQRSEGNFPCFATALSGDCDQTGCLWRSDCLTMAKKLVAA